MEFGFPEITDSFLLGQDILYSQFNSVNFYVEDVEQENFYYEILRKLFPGVAFEKIFPLGGKGPVTTEAANSLGDNKKVFIVDLDFDEILSKRENYPNLFYLEKYSIENYLIEFDAIKELIKEERPKLKDDFINSNFNINNFLTEVKNLFSELIQYYLVIQKHSLGIVNVNNDTARFCDFTQNPAQLKQNSVQAYYNSVESALLAKNSRFKISRQLATFRRHLSNTTNALNNIPGKYILNFMKYRIEHLFSLPQMTLESFTYRLAKNCSLSSLYFLRDRVNSYILQPTT